jgi:hypothetical protein
MTSFFAPQTALNATPIFKILAQSRKAAKNDKPGENRTA